MKINQIKLAVILVGVVHFNLCLAAIPEKQIDSFAAQIKIAQDTQKPLSARWQALLKSSELANYEQLQEIKKFTRSSDWYMRNAALVALEKIGIDHAVDEAKLLLKDKALVVRSAAVDVIAKRLTLENRQVLAQELNKSYNFKNSKSLWIRPKIFSIIAAKSNFDDRMFFAKYLFDHDENIQKIAVQKLEQFTEVKLSGESAVVEWQKYVKKKGWL